MHVAYRKPVFHVLKPNNKQAGGDGPFSKDVSRKGIESPYENKAAKSPRTCIPSSCNTGPRSAVNCSDWTSWESEDLRWPRSDHSLLEPMHVYVISLNFILYRGFLLYLEISLFCLSSPGVSWSCMLLSQKAGLGGKCWAMMSAKDSLADPWELWDLRVVSSPPLHPLGTGYGTHWREPDLGQVTLYSCSSSEGKRVPAVGCGPPATSTEPVGQHWRGVGSTSQCPPQACIRTRNHHLEKPLFTRSSDFIVCQGDREGHNPFSYNAAITLIEGCLKYQRGFVCKYVERIIYNYMGVKLTFKTKYFEVCTQLQLLLFYWQIQQILNKNKMIIFPGDFWIMVHQFKMNTFNSLWAIQFTHLAKFTKYFKLYSYINIFCFLIKAFKCLRGEIHDCN